jgi:hypothetical protein
MAIQSKDEHATMQRISEGKKPATSSKVTRDVIATIGFLAIIGIRQEDQL